ncbi:MAG: hypothetical protein JNM99_14795 [Verrucomicrobiaceae bacterium]|nr:hypothetical protein [Verrucomicrobiaceae bacterium]
MAFRADEQARIGREHAIDYLLSNLPVSKREQGQAVIDELIEEYGPVVQYYPSWHPLMTANGDKRELGRYPKTRPDEGAGYKGLDHTIYFRNAFISCPYGGAKTIINSVKKLKGHQDATISAEELDIPLYYEGTTPVVVKCDWHAEQEIDGTVPKRAAVGLLLEQEVPCWRWAQVAETWENMRHYILGSPRGSKSSLFVSQETGNAMKVAYMSLINGGLFGPIYK